MIVALEKRIVEEYRARVENRNYYGSMMGQVITCVVFQPRCICVCVCVHTVAIRVNMMKQCLARFHSYMQILSSTRERNGR